MTGKEVQSIISENIKCHRKIRNLSQAALAEKLGISVNHLCNIENSKRWLSVNVLAKMAEVLYMDPYELLKSPETLGSKEEAILRKYIDETEDALSKTIEKMRSNYLQHG